MSKDIYDSEETVNFVWEKLEEINKHLGSKHNIALAIAIGDKEVMPFFKVLDKEDGKCREVERSILIKCVEQLTNIISDCDVWYDDNGVKKE